MKFKKAGRLYVPEHLSSSPAGGTTADFLRSSGISEIRGVHHIFGKETSLGDIRALIEPINPKDLLVVLFSLARHLAHKGVQGFKDDSVQQKVLKAMLDAGLEQGFETSAEANKMSQTVNFPAFSFETLLALIGEVLRSDLTKAGLNPRDEASVRRFSLALGMMTDQVYPDPIEQEQPIGRQYWMNFLRENLCISPFQGTMNSFHQRISRLFDVYQRCFEKMKPEIRRALDDALVKTIGITSEEFFPLIYPLNVGWILNNDFQDPTPFRLSLFHEKPELFARMKTVLARISLDVEDYSEMIFELEKQKGPRYFRSADFLRELVKKPLIKVDGDIYHLVAPQLLLRNIELALSSAYISNRDQNIAQYRDLKSPLGKAFENYAADVISTQFASVESEFVGPIFQNGPLRDDGDELCDAIIQDPKATIIFEIKDRTPKLTALDILSHDTSEFESWLIETFYYKRPAGIRRDGKTPGALWQLRGAAEYLLAGRNKFTPSAIVPVIVLSEDLITDLPLYKILDEEVEKLGIFKDLDGVKPFVFISAGELQYLCAQKLPKQFPLLQDVFLEKSTDKDARATSWTNFIRAIGCERMPSKHDEKNTEELLRQTSKLFSKEEQLDFEKKLSEKS